MLMTLANVYISYYNIVLISYSMDDLHHLQRVWETAQQTVLVKVLPVALTMLFPSKVFDHLTPLVSALSDLFLAVSPISR